MSNVIGIDLGTTNTAVSVLVDGRPIMLEDSHGYKVLPSVVWVSDEGEIKVGQQCKSLLVTDPTRTAFAVKRLIGRHFASPEVADADPRTGYTIAEAPDGGCLVELSSGTYTPVEVSAKILETAKEMAESALGGPVDEAVITVPAYFNHAQRAATLEAAQLAGLKCERLLNEPTAAALAYGFRKEIDRTLLIFDLGGGTFDVSALRLRAVCTKSCPHWAIHTWVVKTLTTGWWTGWPIDSSRPTALTFGKIESRFIASKKRQSGRSASCRLLSPRRFRFPTLRANSRLMKRSTATRSPRWCRTWLTGHWR
jgi:hypothetical protein